MLYDETILKQVDTAEARRIASPQQLAYAKGRTDERNDWLLYFRARQIAISDVAVVPPP